MTANSISIVLLAVAIIVNAMSIYIQTEVNDLISARLTAIEQRSAT